MRINEEIIYTNKEPQEHKWEWEWYFKLILMEIDIFRLKDLWYSQSRDRLIDENQ